MYIFGKRIGVGQFASLYGIFENELDANNYAKTHQRLIEEERIIMSIVNLHFPFFILNNVGLTKPRYKTTNKKNLRERIEKLDRLNDYKTIYFNLLRINHSMYNEDFPKESIKFGRYWHLHFTDHDIREIDLHGFDTYWNSILIA